MTKKEYISLAQAIKNARVRGEAEYPEITLEHQSKIIGLVVQELITVLETNNPRFDMDKFIHATIK